MKIPNSLLLTYQEEYETTPDLTIANLCEKYEVETKQLKGYTKWTKRVLVPEGTSTLDTLDKLPEPPVNSEHSLSRERESTPLVIATEEALGKDIDEFKTLAMAHALKFMRNDAEFAEVKEFKDMVSIVGTIEASIKDTKPENTINIAIQNIVKEFKDDC